MWSITSTLGVLLLWLSCQVFATSISVLDSGFNSPANVSARARVQKPTRCPSQCNTYDPTNWFLYPSSSRVAKCNETMLLDFMIYNPLNNSDSRHSLYSCTVNDTSILENLSEGSSCSSDSVQSKDSYEIGLWSATETTASAYVTLDSSPLQMAKEYMIGNCQKSSIFAFSEAGKTAVGIYTGGSLQYAQNIEFAVQELTEILESASDLQGAVLQYCGANSNYTLGIAVDFTGDLAAVQQYVRTWSDGECISGFTKSENVSTTLYSSNASSIKTSSSHLKSNSTLSVRNSNHHAFAHTHFHNLQRRSTCSYVQVVSGDSCASLAAECDITDDEFYEYNTASDLCSTLAVDQYICCSSGSLPDFAPSTYANGTCYTYDVVSGDTCSAIAAAYTLTVDDIDNFNNDTWGWYGCDDLQAGQAICLSNGTAPYPMAITNAVCGPQVPGTNFTGTNGAADWAALNPCPLNACCDIWGECGTTPDYCNDTLAASGAPGTAPAGSNGCIFNCGTTIVNDATEPSSYASVGYFEAYNVERSCLNMNAISIDPAKYTHVHFAFGNITSNFSISIAGQEQQFKYFQELTGMKKIISFGGWDFSTSIDTYMIFREGVTSENRDTLATNVADFVKSNDLDGVDFDWEYPGEPDIAGIPAGSDEDGSNYLAFLKAVRALLPEKSISISAPASYWYLKAFPIAEMADVVDYIVYMTYDLHGTWDLGDAWSQDGCTAGNCLFSHVNLTETMWSLAMITKAQVATSSIMVGVTSYGRSFEMTTAGCYASDCTWDAAGAAGPCTVTAGYIANAEINQILADYDDAEYIFSSGDDSDILVYNQTQWVAYMTNTTKSTRTAYYKTFNFAGTSEWAIDLEEYELFDTSSLTLDELTTELSSYSESLGLDVNYNLACIDLIPGDNTTAELEEYVILGALQIDATLTEYAGDPSNWYQRMTDGYTDSGATCGAFPDPDLCMSLNEDLCTEGEISDELFWAAFLAQELYDTLYQWYTAFNEASFVSSLAVSTLATTFTPTTQGSTLSFDSFLSAFSTGLGLAASYVPEDEVIINGISSGVSTVETIVSLFPAASTFTLPDESDIATALDDMLSQLVLATTDSLLKLADSIFEAPNNASILPTSLITGPFEHPVANYFYNAKIVSVPDSIAWTNIMDNFNTTIQKYLVGAALGAGDYYILRDAYTAEDKCTDTAKYYIDGSCYTLAYPGSSSCAQGLGLQADATSDTINSIISYGIDVEDMITNSYTCQNETGEYYGSLSVDVSDVISSGSVPTCFYNLPVFDLVPTTDFDNESPFEISPCWISRIINETVEAETPVVGETYLPPNLASVFTIDQCVCGGTVMCKRTLC